MSTTPSLVSEKLKHGLKKSKEIIRLNYDNEEYFNINDRPTRRKKCIHNNHDDHHHSIDNYFRATMYCKI